MYFFDNLQTLANAIKKSEINDKDKECLLNKVRLCINKCIEYFNHVVKMESLALNTISWNTSIEFIYKKYDEERRMLHDMCISACKDIDELCEEFDVDPICNVQQSDRKKVADLCGLIVSGLYMKGINETRTFDELITEFAHNNEKAICLENNEWIR